MKIVAVSPQPSDDEMAAITAALARAYGECVNEFPVVRSRWGREPKLAATPELKLGTWRQTARLEVLDAGV